jgi:crotonobetainyl-CoA:carnitine CoA-transferase CaiB-like acyl-CoA transferase
VRYDGKTASVRLAPQPLGAHTAEVLAELGFSSAEIAALVRDGVVHVYQTAEDAPQRTNA